MKIKRENKGKILPDIILEAIKTVKITLYIILN